MIKAVALLAAALIPAQCGAVPPGEDVGGDGNPSTGFCEISYEETAGGVRHRYPLLLDPSLRLIAGKVIFTCDRAPKSHHASGVLQTRWSGAGQPWRDVDRQESSRIPRPKDSLFLRGHCDPRTVAYWRVLVTVEGAGPDVNGKPNPFKAEDQSPNHRIECP